MKMEKFLSDLASGVAHASASAIQRMHTDAQQQQQELQAQQTYYLKMQNSVLIQHDLAFSMQGMTPPGGLTPVYGPQSLTYLPESCTDFKSFAYFWQKSVRKYPLSQDTLKQIAHRINSRIEQLGIHLQLSGYSPENIQSEYPALWNGFRVADIYNIPDGVILVVRLR